MIKASNDTRTLIRILLIPVLFTVFLYFGKPILVPLLFAILLAMLTAPLCRFLDGKHFSRSVSCMICVLVLLLSGFALAWLLISQLFVFLKDIDLIKERAAGIIGGIMNKIELWFNIPSEKQQDLLQQQMTVIESTLQTEFGKIFGHITNTLVDTGMVLIFLFLLLFHKEKYESFF